MGWAHLVDFLHSATHVLLCPLRRGTLTSNDLRLTLANCKQPLNDLFINYNLRYRFGHVKPLMQN